MTCVVDPCVVDDICQNSTPHLSQTRRGVDSGGKQPENLSPNFSGCIKLDAMCVLYRYVHVFYGGLGKPKIESSAFSALT